MPLMNKLLSIHGECSELLKWNYVTMRHNRRAIAEPFPNDHYQCEKDLRHFTAHREGAGTHYAVCSRSPPAGDTADGSFERKNRSNSSGVTGGENR